MNSIHNVTKNTIRKHVGKHITAEVCCNNKPMRVSTKRFDNHFRIASVCQKCERRHLWIFKLDGTLIKYTN